MTSIGEQEAALLLLDRQILELNERINALRDVIDRLESEGGDSSNQVQLLSDMLESLHTLQQFRAEVLKTLIKSA
jgi:uncharacterized small protein (DUF1192 family)